MGTLSMLRKMRGVAAVELAVLLVPLVIITFGMAELGRAFYYYNGAVKSVRSASRYLSMQERGAGEAAARCLAVYGIAAAGSAGACAGDDPVVPGLETGMVDITYEPAVATGYSTSTIDLVTVTISGLPFQAVTSFPVEVAAFGPITSTMRQGRP
jgi:Flp pilus assembly protein TadG